MIRDDMRVSKGEAGRFASPKRPRRTKHTTPAVESLEQRQVLSTILPTTERFISFQHSVYEVSVTGPGSFIFSPAAKGQFNLDLFGTTTASSINITQTQTHPRANNSLLPIGRIAVHSGQLGQILGAGALNLVGSIKSTGSIQSIQLGSVGPKAQILATGGLGSLNVSGAINLGAGGKIVVAGDLSGGLQAGAIIVNGGLIAIGHDLSNLTTGSLDIENSGRFVVGNDLKAMQDSGPANITTKGSFLVGEDVAGLTFQGDVTMNTGGQILVARDVTGPIQVSGTLVLNGAQISVGRDVTGAFSVNGEFAAINNGSLTVGRDLSGGISVNGNIDLQTGGNITIGRNAGTGTASTASGTTSTSATGITVIGNLITAGGGTISVGGDLNAFKVDGFVLGSGTSSVDLTVGLDLNNWLVLGGAPGQGGVDNFNVDVGKNIQGFSTLHGLFNDFITAGVLITNATTGADGPVAVFDTEIRAGLQITNVTFGGDVESDHATNPQGRNTRIVAGENRAGHFESGGNMVNVVVTGSLINAVLAASVEPNAAGIYPAPGGGIYRFPSTGDANGGVPYAAPPFADPASAGIVLPGTINHNFAPSPTATATVPFTVALPTQSTVDGQVITTAHSSTSDFAGIFAADTTGVFVGLDPLSTSFQ
jgi:hypothetical protein